MGIAMRERLCIHICNEREMRDARKRHEHM